MPFASDKQRRYLWSQKPEVAKQIAYKQEGGLLDGLTRPEINTVEDLERVAAARNQELAAVAAELGITPEMLQNTAGSSADQANDIARQIWGDNAPQLRQTENAAELAQDRAGVLAELARQNPGTWGNKAANPNVIQPAKPKGFLEWAGEAAGDAWDAGTAGAGNAFQSAVDYATGEASARAENEAYSKALSEMSTEELLEHLNQKYPEGQAPAQVQGQPVEQSGGSFWDSVKGAASSLNPISDANASSRGVGTLAGLATVPNPHVGQMGFGNQVAGAEGFLGGQQGSGAQAQTRPESIAFQYGRATDDEARPVYNKGWFSNSWGTETPEQIAQRQEEANRSFVQQTGWNIPDANENQFLSTQFEREATDPSGGWESENRDYWGHGENVMNTEREVTYADGSQANAMTAQGDLEIQNILNDASWDNNDDDNGWDQPTSSYSGWDDGEDDSDWDDTVSTSPSWDYDDEEEAIGWEEPAPVQQDSGGDDGGGGGGK